MLNFKHTLLTGLLLLSLNAMADVPWGQGNSVPTPRQEYREAINPNAPATKPNPVVVPTAPAAVTPATPAVTAPAPAAPVVTKPKSRASSTTDATSLQDQINLLNQNNVLFAQGVNAKFEELNREVVILQARVQQLGQAMVLLNQEWQQKSLMPKKGLGSLEIGLSEYTIFDYLFWLAVIVLILIVLSLFRRGRKNSAKPLAKAVVPKSTDELEGDYDYLGSNESIPAKLNLARAYVAMGNFAEAKQVLHEVLASGDNKQCMEAEALLKKIPAS